MTYYSIAPLLSSIAYAALLAVVLRNGRTRMRALFGVYLLISVAHTLATFIALSDFFPDSLEAWIGVFNVCGIASLVAYYHFIVAFTRRKGRVGMVLGYASVALLVVPLVALGLVPRSAQVVDGGLIVDYGQYFPLLAGIGFVYMSLSAMLLVRRLRSLQDPRERSRVTYLLAGIGLFVIISMREAITPLPRYPFAQIGHLVNASVIAYAIYRHRLLDTRLVIRKGLTYAGITASITAFFLALLFGVNDLLGITWSTPTGLAITAGAVVVMAAGFGPLKSLLEKMADRLVYGSRYDFRKTVVDVAGQLSDVIEIEQLADAMLQPIVQAVGASQASLLFADGSHYTARFAERLEPGGAVIPVSLRSDGPVVAWLEGEGKPLHRNAVNTNPEFKGLWAEDSNSIDAAQIEVLCPVKTKQKLVAILAMSKKHPRGFYGSDDMDLLMTLAHEAAVAIENAQLYERAKLRANTDDLTGLFNHRHFHERLEEEIARSSRFGDVFSLIVFDLDNFKTYNDVYGHLTGDAALKQVGAIIDHSFRAMDIGFRYGGDEFAVLLPETPIELAAKAAERLRKTIEAQTGRERMPLACSLGVAAWPIDGVTRDEVVRAADAALYHAKNTGGDRMCLARDVVLAEALRTSAMHEPQNRNAVVNTIYALAATVDAKDHGTYGHSKKVSTYATEVAEALGYSRDDIERLRAAALLHDIGKIGVSDRLLTKRGPLLDADWSLIRSHPDLGVTVIKHVDGLRDCLAGIKYHHEHYDGTGYPAGLKGEDIPLDARILAVADVFDAMTSERPYRDGRSTEEEALEEMARCAGTQLDPLIVGAFANVRRSIPPSPVLTASVTN